MQEREDKVKSDMTKYDLQIENLLLQCYVSNKDKNNGHRILIRLQSHQDHHISSTDAGHIIDIEWSPVKSNTEWYRKVDQSNAEDKI